MARKAEYEESILLDSKESLDESAEYQERLAKTTADHIHKYYKSSAEKLEKELDKNLSAVEKAVADLQKRKAEFEEEKMSFSDTIKTNVLNNTGPGQMFNTSWSSFAASAVTTLAKGFVDTAKSSLKIMTTDLYYKALDQMQAAYETNFTNLAGRLGTDRQATHDLMHSAVHQLADSVYSGAINANTELIPALAAAAEKGFKGNQAISIAMTDSIDKKIMPWLDSASTAWTNLQFNLTDGQMKSLKAQQLLLQESQSGNRLLQSGVINKIDSDLAPILSNIDYNTMDASKLPAQTKAMMEALVQAGHDPDQAYAYAQKMVSIYRDPTKAFRTGGSVADILAAEQASVYGGDVFDISKVYTEQARSLAGMSNLDAGMAAETLYGGPAINGGMRAEDFAQTGAMNYTDLYRRASQIETAGVEVYEEEAENVVQKVTATVEYDNEVMNDISDTLYDWNNVIHGLDHLETISKNVETIVWELGAQAVMTAVGVGLDMYNSRKNSKKRKTGGGGDDDGPDTKKKKTGDGPDGDGDSDTKKKRTGGDDDGSDTKRRTDIDDDGDDTRRRSRSSDPDIDDDDYSRRRSSSSPDVDSDGRSSRSGSMFDGDDGPDVRRSSVDAPDAKSSKSAGRGMWGEALDNADEVSDGIIKNADSVTEGLVRNSDDIIGGVARYGDDVIEAGAGLAGKAAAKTAGKEATEAAVKGTAKAVAKNVGEDAAEKLVKEGVEAAVEKGAKKAVAKGAAKTVAKAADNFIPVVGNAMSIASSGYGVYRAAKEGNVGAGISYGLAAAANAVGLVADFIPGLGTAVSAVADVVGTGFEFLGDFLMGAEEEPPPPPPVYVNYEMPEYAGPSGSGEAIVSETRSIAEQAAATGEQMEHTLERFYADVNSGSLTEQQARAQAVQLGILTEQQAATMDLKEIAAATKATYDKTVRVSEGSDLASVADRASNAIKESLDDEFNLMANNFTKQSLQGMKSEWVEIGKDANGAAVMQQVRSIEQGSEADKAMQKHIKSLASYIQDDEVRQQVLSLIEDGSASWEDFEQAKLLMESASLDLEGLHKASTHGVHSDIWAFGDYSRAEAEQDMAAIYSDYAQDLSTQVSNLQDLIDSGADEETIKATKAEIEKTMNEMNKIDINPADAKMILEKNDNVGSQVSNMNLGKLNYGGEHYSNKERAQNMENAVTSKQDNYMYSSKAAFGGMLNAYRSGSYSDADWSAEALADREAEKWYMDGYIASEQLYEDYAKSHNIKSAEFWDTYAAEWQKKNGKLEEGTVNWDIQTSAVKEYVKWKSRFDSANLLEDFVLDPKSGKLIAPPDMLRHGKMELVNNSKSYNEYFNADCDYEQAKYAMGDYIIDDASVGLAYGSGEHFTSPSGRTYFVLSDGNGGATVEHIGSYQIDAYKDKNAQIMNSYAVGTPYVEEDQVAVIHEGEAIIPESQNMARLRTLTGVSAEQASATRMSSDEIVSAITTGKDSTNEILLKILAALESNPAAFGLSITNTTPGNNSTVTLTPTTSNSRGIYTMT